MSDEPITTRMYLSVRTAGEGLAVCIGFDDESGNEQVSSIGMRCWSPSRTVGWGERLGEVLFGAMQVTDVDSLEKIQGRPVRVLVRDGIPVELIHRTNDNIRARLP